MNNEPTCSSEAPYLSENYVQDLAGEPAAVVSLPRRVPHGEFLQ